MLPTLIVVGLVLVAAGVLLAVTRRRSVQDDVSAGDAVLRKTLAAVPENAFDAKLRIVRSAS